MKRNDVRDLCEWRDARRMLSLANQELLVVTQTRQIHHQLEEFMETLRRSLDPERRE